MKTAKKTPTKIKKLLQELPDSPGVYKMYDEEDKILYIGKAKNLRKRVKQYFQKDYEHSSRTAKLIEKIADIKWTVVDSELEAVILESNLLKELQPKYNVVMKDDKNYVYIKITRDEDYPRIQIVRKVQRDGARYIGPKTAAHKVKESFKVLKKIFPFRHCGLDIDIVKKKADQDYEVKITNSTIKYPCLDYFIKRCAAPCIGKIGKEEYKNIVDNVERFFDGKMENIYSDLETQMFQAAKSRQFEKAARIRDRIKTIEDITERQKVSSPNHSNADIINYCLIHERAYFNLFQIRDGKLLGQENFTLNAPLTSESNDLEVLETFLLQYYEIATDMPQEILIPHAVENESELETIFSQMAKRKVKFVIPKIGDKNKLLEMCLNNARIFADRNRPSWQNESEITQEATKELRKILKIRTPLKRIECYDISHLSGTDTVGSMVVFENGAPKPAMYRKFKLRTVINKPDDYRSMEEVLYRRLNKLSEKIAHQDFIFKKARKKDIPFIEKNNKVKVGKHKELNFFILEYKKQPVGFISTIEYNAKSSELRNLWLSKKFRGEKLGHKLIKEAIKKTKAKRIYIVCRELLKEYHQLLGFEEINKIPDELIAHKKECDEAHSDNTVMAIEKIRLKEDESFSKQPDLIIVDGGKGQLATATKVLKELKIKIPYISLAKKLEEVFLPENPAPILLERNSEALKLLQRARDEAHRFAISYNKTLRKKHFS